MAARTSKFFGGGSDSDESDQDEKQTQEVVAPKTTNRFARAAGLLGALTLSQLQALRFRRSAPLRAS